MSIQVRCTGCSTAGSFRASRGTRMGELRCSSCGGAFEKVISKIVPGPHPSDPAQTLTSNDSISHYEYVSKTGRYKLDSSRRFHCMETFSTRTKNNLPQRRIGQLEDAGIIRLFIFQDGKGRWTDYQCLAGDKITWKRNGSRGCVHAVIIGWSINKPGYVKVENWQPDWSEVYQQVAQVWIKTKSVLSILKYH